MIRENFIIEQLNDVEASAAAVVLRHCRRAGEVGLRHNRATYR